MNSSRFKKTDICDLKPQGFSQIDVSEGPPVIYARVTWIKPEDRSKRDNPFIKYLLRDETSMIEAVAVGNDCIQKFKRELPLTKSLTKVYKLSGFSVSRVNDAYRNVGHKYFIYLSQGTNVQPVLDAKLQPREVFYTTENLLTECDSLLENSCIDVVGKIVEVGDVGPNYYNVTIGNHDGGHCLKLTFFGVHAKMVYKVGVYLLLRQVLFRKERGTISLSTLYRTYIEECSQRFYMDIIKTQSNSDFNPNERIDEITDGLHNEDMSLEDGGLNLNPEVARQYHLALESGKEESNTIRVMVIGHQGAGKTTLVNKLLDIPVVTDTVESTDGIDIHVHKYIALDDGRWIPKTESHETEILRRLASNVGSFDSGHGSMEVDNTEKGILIGTPDTRASCNTNQSNNGHSKVHSLCHNHPISVSTSTSNVYNLRKRPSSVKNVNLCKFQKAVSQERLDVGKNIDIWDFAGQFIFYATHQLFLSPRAIYLLVVDLTKGLNDVIHEEPGTHLNRVSDFCEFWMNSINTFVGTTAGSPKVLLVGTRRDLLKESNLSHKTCNKLFKNMRGLLDPFIVEHFHTKPFITGLGQHDYPDEKEALRKCIVEVSKSEYLSTQPIPKRWIPLENELMIRNDKNVKHLTLDKVCEIDAQNDQPINDREEIKAFLSYHHELGTLVYFNEDGLSDTIVLDPKWIIDAFTSVITTQHFFGRKSNKNLKDVWEEIRNAKISEKNLEKVWKEPSNEDFFENKDILLRFMQRLHMIAKIQSFDNASETLRTSDEFIIPSFLSNIECNESTLEHVLNLPKGSHILSFNFENTHVSPTVYHHLVATAIGKWEPYAMKGNFLLHDKIACFKLDRTHLGIIRKYSRSIDIFVKTHLDGVGPSPAICDKLRRCTKHVLEHELKRCSVEKKMPFKMKVKCLCVSDEKVDLLVDENEYVDLDLLKETENYTIACAKSHRITLSEVMHQWFPDEPFIDGLLKYLTDGTKDKVVEHKHAFQIADIIEEGGDMLASKLGMTVAEIKRYKDEYKNDKSFLYFMLIDWWIKRSKTPPTFGILIESIDNVKALGYDRDKLRNFLEKLCIEK